MQRALEKSNEHLTENRPGMCPSGVLPESIADPLAQHQMGHRSIPINLKVLQRRPPGSFVRAAFLFGLLGIELLPARPMYADEAPAGAYSLGRKQVTDVAPEGGWTVEGETDESKFGICASSAGDVNADGYGDLLVGAWGYDDYTGRAYLYLGASVGPDTTPSWTATGEHVDSLLGQSVRSAGDVNGDGYSDVIVGARGYSTYAGRAAVFLGSAAGLSTLEAWSVQGEEEDSNLGRSVSSAGDVNGDGYGDVIIGAPTYGEAGKAYLYLGSAEGLETSAAWTAQGSSEGEEFGHAVASAGDVNGDGFSDVIVGTVAGLYDATGKAYVYLGSPQGLGTSVHWVQGTDDLYFGAAVASAGDVNGDGYSDVVVGACIVQGERGAAYLYLGSAQGLSKDFAWSVQGEDGSSYGCSVASAGDVNGDGFADVVVSAFNTDGEDLGNEGWYNNAGKVYVYLGAASGLSTEAADWSGFRGAASGESYGFSVSSAGDVDGDGYTDIIVGAPSSALNRGSAYLHLGEAQFGEPTGSSGGCSCGGIPHRQSPGFGSVALVIGAVGFLSRRALTRIRSCISLSLLRF